MSAVPIGETSFDKATLAIPLPDRPEIFWVLQQDGNIYAFDPAANTTSAVLDLSGKVDDGPDEAGLLSLAFDPDFASNREVIVSYTAPSPFRSVVSRFKADALGQSLDPSSEEILLTVDQPYINHNGGHVAFGPGGYLYIAFGDGGSAGDPGGNGQNTDVLLGKILRIDVHAGAPYAIPSDNPFAFGGGRPEIYAWGLRNPWRFSFDPASGALWVGDVGQDSFEEINLVQRGGNYGWNVMEGPECFVGVECDNEGMTLPVAYTEQEDGDQSVIGGVIYLGDADPSLQGSYVWGDFISGRVYALITDPLSGESERITLAETGLSITHIGLDAEGEIVIVDRQTGLYRLQPQTPADPSAFPQKLSETGCFDPVDPNRPLGMLVPYTVAHPFWSDDAEKVRWLSIPDGTTIGYDAEGDLVFPVGSVAVKEFYRDNRKLETRLLVRHDDGAWAGYSYVWNDSGTDADLALAGAELQTTTGPWSVPSRLQCVQCHTAATGGSLGLSLRQLDVAVTRPDGSVENQIDYLVRLGMADLPPVRTGAHPRHDDTTAAVDARARAYLDVNCAFCHFEGGTGGGEIDLREEISLAESQMCEPPQDGDLGVEGARVVVPGSPDLSILSLRMHRRDSAGMPPIGSLRADTAGAALVDSWIEGLSSCP